MQQQIQEPSSIYLRIKREKRVFFFECHQPDLVETLKKKLQNFYKQDSNEMRIFYDNRLLDDKASLTDQNIKNDAELFLKLKKPSQEWEE